MSDVNLNDHNLDFFLPSSSATSHSFLYFW